MKTGLECWENSGGVLAADSSPEAKGLGRESARRTILTSRTSVTLARNRTRSPFLETVWIVVSPALTPTEAPIHARLKRVGNFQNEVQMTQRAS